MWDWQTRPMWHTKIEIVHFISMWHNTPTYDLTDPFNIWEKTNKHDRMYATNNYLIKKMHYINRLLICLMFCFRSVSIICSTSRGLLSHYSKQTCSSKEVGYGGCWVKVKLICHGEGVDFIICLPSRLSWIYGAVTIAIQNSSQKTKTFLVM